MTKIYGSSDDLIEVEGDIDNEFYCYAAEEPTYLALSDGTLLSVLYDDDGIWRFHLIVEGLADFSKTEGLDDEIHSDIITLDGPIRWAILGDEIAK